MRKQEEVTLGPLTDKEADQAIKAYKGQGVTAKKKPREGRPGEFMVEIKPE